MLVTFTNTTSSPIFISLLYKQLGATGSADASVTVSKTLSELDQEQSLKALVESGDVTLSFASESGDSAAMGAQESMASFDDAGRPAASAWPLFSPIWNTDDNAPNWSDGTNWRDAAGTIT
jgi:hypothetical protein